MRFFGFLIGLLLMSSMVHAQLNMTLLGELDYDQKSLTEVWGYVNEQAEEFAIVCLAEGISIVDLNNPADPQELFFIEQTYSAYRDVQTLGDHAYFVNEAGGGLLIMDLSQLPEKIDTSSWKGADGQFSTSHNIAIQADGKAFLLGSRSEQSGTLIVDLSQDPSLPTEIGSYPDNYVDNAYVRNDTLWTAEIFNGWFGIVDVKDPNQPNVLAVQNTPSENTHGCWLHPSGDYLFATDEINNGSLTAFRVSDLQDIEEVDSYRSPHSEAAIPHSILMKDQFLLLSYYTDGIIVLDASYPNNLVEIGHYDTSPLSGNNLQGCWGMYPWLPSGNLLVADREEGLKILCPNYQPAAFIEGSVTDASSGGGIFNAQIQWEYEAANTKTNLFGVYSTGVPIGGNYTISVSANGYCTKRMDVELVAGNQLKVDITLEPTSSNCVSEELVEAQAFVDSITQCNYVFTGIEEVEAQNKISEVYPNPSSGVFYVSLKGKNTSVRVFHPNGQLLMEEEGVFTFDLSDYPTGVYLMEVETETTTEIHKLIKF